MSLIESYFHYSLTCPNLNKQIKKSNTMNDTTEKVTLKFVRNMIGPVNPIGDTDADKERFSNLNTMAFIAESLIKEIAVAYTTNRNSVAYSEKCSAKYASDFLKRIMEELNSMEIDTIKYEADDIACPFCGEDEFDKNGLKHHLQNHCEKYLSM